MKLTKPSIARCMYLFLAIMVTSSTYGMKRSTVIEPTNAVHKITIINKLPIDVAFYIKGSGKFVKDEHYKIISDTTIKKLPVVNNNLRLSQQMPDDTIIPKPTKPYGPAKTNERVYIKTPVLSDQNIQHNPYEKTPIIAEQRKDIMPTQKESAYQTTPATVKQPFTSSYEKTPIIVGQNGHEMVNTPKKHPQYLEQVQESAIQSRQEKGEKREVRVPVDEFPIYITIYNNQDEQDVLAKFTIEANDKDYEFPLEIILEQLFTDYKHQRTLELTFVFKKNGSYVRRTNQLPVIKNRHSSSKS